MKTFKINQSQYRQFFASVNKYHPAIPGEEDYWRSKLTGFRIEESTVLVNKGEVTDKLWFVLSGLVVRHSDLWKE